MVKFSPSHLNNIEGEYYKQNELTTDLITFKPGDRAYLPTMKACTFGVKDHMWALEYSRGSNYLQLPYILGLLPLALPFQMTGTLFATLDFTSLFRMQFIYAKLLFHELLVNRKI